VGARAGACLSLNACRALGDDLLADIHAACSQPRVPESPTCIANGADGSRLPASVGTSALGGKHDESHYHSDPVGLRVSARASWFPICFKGLEKPFGCTEALPRPESGPTIHLPESRSADPLRSDEVADDGAACQQLLTQTKVFRHQLRSGPENCRKGEHQKSEHWRHGLPLNPTKASSATCQRKTLRIKFSRPTARAGAARGRRFSSIG
jgi:hypothetical protein